MFLHSYIFRKMYICIYCTTNIKSPLENLIPEGYSKMVHIYFPKYAAREMNFIGFSTFFRCSISTLSLYLKTFRNMLILLYLGDIPNTFRFLLILNITFVSKIYYAYQVRALIW